VVVPTRRPSRRSIGRVPDEPPYGLGYSRSIGVRGQAANPGDDSLPGSIWSVEVKCSCAELRANHCAGAQKADHFPRATGQAHWALQIAARRHLPFGRLPSSPTGRARLSSARFCSADENAEHLDGRASMSLKV